MKIFISGPISGNPNFQERFKEAEIIILKRNHVPINPAAFHKIPAFEYFNRAECQKIEFAMLECCDGIYMMEGWSNSRGARLEHDYAKVLGLSIFYFDDPSRDGKLISSHYGSK